MDVRVRDALTRILGSKRAARVAIGALAKRWGLQTARESRCAARDFDGGAELCTRARVRSPDHANSHQPIRRGVRGIGLVRIRDSGWR